MQSHLRGGDGIRCGDHLRCPIAFPSLVSSPPAENPEPRWLRGPGALLTSRPPVNRPGLQSKPTAAEEREHSIPVPGGGDQSFRAGHHLFDGMAERLRTKKTVVADGEDRLSTLPDELIQLVLSFLPSRQAVQTCVLATRWRTLWKSVPAIRLDAYAGTYQFGQDLSHFVHSLLQHRDPTPLRECEVLFYDHHHGQDEEVIERDFDLWLRYAVSCKARVIRFEIIVYFPLRLSAGTLISHHLTRLILRNVRFDDFSLDVLGCQLLEVLDIQECIINIETVFPKSLQHLMIRDTDL
ncbi:hypothetical protein ACQJBY_051048 [Aegilops geniculata]